MPNLLPAATRTASGAGDVLHPFLCKTVFLQLDVSAAADAAGDTLDVYVQTTVDGTNWVDIYRFAQVLGNGGTKRYFGKLAWNVALTEFENAASLSAGTGRAIVGDRYRVRWEITNAGPFLAFTGTGPYTAVGIAADGFNSGDSPFDLSVAEAGENSIVITDDGDGDAVVASATRPAGGEWTATVGTITRASFTFSVTINGQEN